MTQSGPPSEDDQDLSSPNSYIHERLEQYQGWYDRKAVATKALYLRIRTATVAGGACVPALINVDARYVRAVTTLLSLMVVILVSLESVYHYREQWKNYRSTEQMLGHEKVYFRTRTGPYEGLPADQAFKLLVERVEAAIAAENSATLSVMTLAPEEVNQPVHRD
jgi:hypothetical protein